MKKLIILLITILILLTQSGCSINVRSGALYTVYPVGYLIERIAGDYMDSEPVQTNDLIQVANASEDIEELLKTHQYLFSIGELENYLYIRKNLVSSSGIETIDLSDMNAIYNFSRYTSVNVNGLTQHIESPYYNGDEFEVIDTYDKDLYLWLDPISTLSMAKDIYQKISSNYVERSANFEANYEALEEDLIALDAEYQKLANKLKKENSSIKFVSMTASFGCWQKAYGFEVYPVCLSRFGSLPTDDQLQIIKEKIKADNVQYIVYEPNMTDEMIALFNDLESELNLKRVNLSNLSSLTDQQINDNKNYLMIMYENLKVLENMVTSNTPQVVETVEAEVEVDE